MDKGKYVSRSTYQKVVEENKKLLADIKVLVEVDGEKYIEVHDRWLNFFQKRRQLGDAIREILTMAREAWNGRCRCGHLHSEHHPTSSHNYSAGRCTVGECRCAHFIHDTKTS